MLNHRREVATGSFWRRWFENPHERHFTDEVRAFVGALDLLLDVPPQMLSRGDLIAVGEDTDQVVTRVEAAIEDPSMAASDAKAALTAAVYMIRERYEQLYKKGATKGD